MYVVVITSSSSSNLIQLHKVRYADEAPIQRNVTNAWQLVAHKIAYIYGKITAGMAIMK